jgi:hypothetical protein
MRREPFHALQDQTADAERERRIGLLLRRMPERMRRAIVWLRRPQAYWIRIPAGVLLILGSALSILPIFGLWMLPLGVLLLAEDVKSLQRVVDRVLEWIERRHPRWMGLDAPAMRPGNQAQ